MITTCVKYLILILFAEAISTIGFIKGDGFTNINFIYFYMNSIKTIHIFFDNYFEELIQQSEFHIGNQIDYIYYLFTSLYLLLH